MVKPGPVLRLNSEEIEPPSTENSDFTSVPILSADDSNFSVLLSSMSGAAPYLAPSAAQNGPEVCFRRAKVLCDYEPKDWTELSLKADEVILVRETSDEDYLIGQKGLLDKGKVPKAFVELLED